MTQKSIGRIVVALLAALATAVTAMAIVHASSGQPQPVEPLSVLFVGDSYTAGAGNEQDAYPTLIAQNAHWDLHIDAQGATGFIADGQGTGNGDTSRLIDRLAEDGRRFPKVDLLIIDAGRNDLSYPTEEIASALSEYLTHARRQWPDAKIVEIFPSFIKSDAYDTYPDLLDKVNASLSTVGGTLVDPIAEGFYADRDLESMLISDKVHPNRLGSAYLADRLIASFRDKGIIPAV